MNAYLLVLLSIILFIILAAWGLKFPRTKKDWQKDRHETFSLLITVIIFLVLFLMLWYVISIVSYPPVMDMIIWGAAICFAIIILAAIFLPHGVKLKFEKKEKKIVEEE